jgi:WD40 repeat protein
VGYQTLNGHRKFFFTFILLLSSCTVGTSTQLSETIVPAQITIELTSRIDEQNPAHTLSLFDKTDTPINPDMSATGSVELGSTAEPETPSLRLPEADSQLSPTGIPVTSQITESVPTSQLLPITSFTVDKLQQYAEIKYSPWEIVTALDISPDGVLLAVSAGDFIHLYIVETLELIVSFPIGAISHSIAFSPDGNWLVSGSRDGYARMWDVAAAFESRDDESVPVLKFEAHRKGVNSVVYDPSGDMFATGGNDAIARVWDTTTGEMKAIMIGGTFAVPEIAKTPGGNTLAVVNGDTVRLREIGSERIVGTFLADNSLYCISYNPSGTLLAAGDINNLIRIWDPEAAFRTGVDGYPQPVMEFSHSGIPDSYQALVWDLTFSPDNSLLVSAGGDKIVNIWEVVSGELSTSLKNHSKAVTSLVISADGHILVSGSLDGTVLLWGVVP